MKIRIPRYGYIGPLQFRGVPIYIHWTFPVGGLLLTFFLGEVTWKTTIPLMAAYTMLILVHELGHAFAAKIASSKVHAVLVMAIGGWCFADEPTSFIFRLTYYAGGIVAQLLSLFFYGDSCTHV